MFGLQEIERLEAEVAHLCATIDPDSIPLPEVEAVWTALAGIERLVAGATVRLARRVEEAGGWRQQGHRSAADWLARQAGTSVGQARGALEASKQLAALPAVEEAVRQGRLSAAQTETVTDAAAAAPEAQRRLVELAGRRSLGELRDECARTKAAADRDAEQAHRRIHAARSCRRRPCPDGAEQILYTSTRDEVAEVWAVISGYGHQEFTRARAEGRREAQDVYAADGLLAMARTAASPADSSVSPAATAQSLSADLEAAVAAAKARRRPVPGKVIVRIDWDAFVRGWPIDGEMCEISGIGPVPVSLVRDMVASGDPFLAAVVTRGVDVATVAHLGRSPTAYQHTALDWRDPTCDVEGCTNPHRLEIDHTDDWSETKITALWALSRKCGHHHDLKTLHGWASVPGVGKRPFVPPGDPRHPGTNAVAGRQRPPPGLASRT